MLLDENCEKCYEVSSQYESQKMRKLSYDQKIKYFMESASSRLNAQALQQQQRAEDKRRAMEIEMKKTEIEIKQKELELELTLLEYESQLVQSEGGFTTETRVICESQDASVTHASHAPSKEVLQTTQPSNVYRADQMSLFTSVSGSLDAYAPTVTCVNPPPSREIPPVLGGYQPPPSSFSSAPAQPYMSSTPKTTVLPSTEDYRVTSQARVPVNSLDNEIFRVSSQSRFPATSTSTSFHGIPDTQPRNIQPQRFLSRDQCDQYSVHASQAHNVITSRERVPLTSTTPSVTSPTVFTSSVWNSAFQPPVSTQSEKLSFNAFSTPTSVASSVIQPPMFGSHEPPGASPWTSGLTPIPTHHQFPTSESSVPFPVQRQSCVPDQRQSNLSGLLPPNYYGGAMMTDTIEPKIHPAQVQITNSNTSPVNDESILKTIASAIANISVTQDLPKIQVQKFDGSPEKFPTFRQRFRQMVESRPLEDSVKMTLLLQFLEGPALKAVQRYEALPGGLTSALKTLEDRFGRASQVVRACVDALVKGPVIQNNDRQGLQQLADDAQITYDTLKSLGYIGEMNTDTLERIIQRLPKWAQTRFVETVNKRRRNQEMPTFKDVVDFLKERAEVMNHPFFSKPQNETASKTSHPSLNARASQSTRDKPTSIRVTTLATTKTDEQCYMCNKQHRLYRCELFKSKSPKERNEFVKTKKICFNCLSSTEHNYKNCKCSTRCQVAGCGKAHHSMLHFTDSSATQPNTSQRDSNKDVKDSVTSQPTTNTSRSSCSTTANNPDVMLQVLPVKILNDKSDVITTYCLIDSGSDVTLIDPSLAKELNLKGSPGNLVLNTVSNSNVSNQATKVSFQLASLSDEDDDDVVDVDTAWATKELAIPIKQTRIADRMARWPHLKTVPFPEVERRKISILLGTNVSQAFIPIEVRRGSPNEPIAIKCCLGWSILGGANSVNSIDQCSNMNCVTSEDMMLSRQVQEFWQIESYGTNNAKTKTLSIEDQHALKTIDDTITKKGDHYQMGLLWKDEEPSLPYNRALAEARLQHLKKRFRRDPDLETKYRAVMDDYLAKGYARKLSAEEASARSDITWYLPHHPVLNPNKPGKVRVVFDAAARFAERSLNDCLVQGPSLTNDLSGVLIRFRQHLVAFTADVEAMFYQVGVTTADTDALRFLWWPRSTDDPPEEYQMQVHIFGAKSSPCCANKALKTTADAGRERYSPEVVETVHRNFYVDDVLKSTRTTEEAINVATGLVNLLKEGGFHLTKFASNRREVLAALPPQERTNPSLNLDLDRLPMERALGIWWDAESDSFQFKVIPTEKPTTKRGVLSVVSSLFDPLGFLAPFVLQARLLLQDLWREGFPWDQQIPEPYYSLWSKWLKSLPHIVTIRIPRCYKSSQLGTIATLQLHNFADASRRGYSAVSYLRMVTQDGKVHCAFVMGKARNTPMKELSIPRLELQAAVQATRLSKTILRELEEPVKEVHFWSDSMTVLQYVRNKTRRFNTFVANRLTEIHESTTQDQWHFVPGTLNPADEGSRGMDTQSFTSECRWLTGPSFLWMPEDQWPTWEINDPPDGELPEVIKDCNATSTPSESQIDALLRRHSSWPRLIRVMSYVMRFIKRARKQEDIGSTISLAEMQSSVYVIVRVIQSQYFNEELFALTKGQSVKANSKIATLNPTLVEGIIRVGGRIHKAPIPFEAAHPIIIPKEHPVASQIVRHYHKILAHAGREHVLSAIRQRYWIVGARSLVRQLVSQCVTCRRREGPVMQQKMADLPKERLVPHQPPFTYTGVDFFGPFHVKRARSTIKIYGCLFVCFNSRAVHIEDVSSLETDTFIQALHRFMAVRGRPKEIWSDNGTNFCGAERELRRSIQELNNDAIKTELHSYEVEWYSTTIPRWRFQPPAASHMSGVWERIIRSVRKAMKAVIGDPQALLGHETLRTVFAEVTSILNSRPICPSSDDPNDLDVLTPNHLLLQRQNISIPPGVFEPDDLCSRKQWRHAQFLANCFWSRWLREYLPTLQARQKWILPRRNLKEGDMVLVVDNTLPRSRWLLGRVTKTLPGRDGYVRTAQVKTRNSTLCRPISKLCLLEEFR